MKKLLLISTILGLSLFGFYHNHIKGETLYVQPKKMAKIEKQILAVEREEIFTPKREFNSTKPKLFTIEMASDMNTTRDHEIEIEATVKNIPNPEECNFWWYEDGMLIGVGTPLKMGFDKGEHLITLKAKTTEGNESVKNILVTAWDYRKTVRLYFNTLSDNFETQNYYVYDHKERLVLRESPYGKYQITFNEDGKEEEIRNEYTHHPEWSDIQRYTYTESGEIDTIRSLNMSEETTQFEKYLYDAEGNFTKILTGNSEDELIDYSLIREQYQNNNREVYYDTTPYETFSTQEDKVIQNEYNQTIYEEYDHGYLKEVNSYEYDKNQTMIKSEKTAHYQNGKNEKRITLYDKEGNELNSEKFYKQDEEVLCHYSSTSTFNDNHQALTTTEKILDGDCQEFYVFNNYERYSYDEDGQITEIQRAEEKGAEEHYTSYKVLNFYSNTLEGDEQ